MLLTQFIVRILAAADREHQTSRTSKCLYLNFSLFMEQCHLLLFCCGGNLFTGIQGVGTSPKKKMTAISISKSFQGRKILIDEFQGFHAEL